MVRVVRESPKVTMGVTSALGSYVDDVLRPQVGVRSTPNTLVESWVFWFKRVPSEVRSSPMASDAAAVRPREQRSVNAKNRDRVLRRVFFMSYLHKLQLRWST